MHVCNLPSPDVKDFDVEIRFPVGNQAGVLTHAEQNGVLHMKTSINNNN